MIDLKMSSFTLRNKEQYASESVKFTLPKLHYSKNALEPYISESTMDFHYDKHHVGYLNKLNELISQDSDMHGIIVQNAHEQITLENIIKIANKNGKVAIFNNAAQVWNHSFYWYSMSNKKTSPSLTLNNKINHSFGSVEKLLLQIKDCGLSQFGSGWVWIVLNDNNNLELMKTSNADLPLIHGKKALLCIDVWEHAYYLDKQNRRNEYLENVSNIIDWNFMEQNITEHNDGFFARILSSN